MNIHDARTPHFRTAPKHTCCQVQTSGKMLTPRAYIAICTHGDWPDVSTVTTRVSGFE